MRMFSEEKILQLILITLGLDIARGLMKQEQIKEWIIGHVE